MLLRRGGDCWVETSPAITSTVPCGSSLVMRSSIQLTFAEPKLSTDESLKLVFSSDKLLSVSARPPAPFGRGTGTGTGVEMNSGASSCGVSRGPSSPFYKDWRGRRSRTCHGIPSTSTT